MSKPMTIKKETSFTVSKQEVWNLLTNPEMTKQYMYGCEIISDWKVGSTVVWKGLAERGVEVIYVKGHVVEVKDKEKVVFTVFDPNMGIEDIPSNYLSLTYELMEVETGTLLRLSQDGFSTAAEGQKRYEDAIKGWEMVLPLMKQMVEK